MVIAMIATIAMTMRHETDDDACLGDMMATQQAANMYMAATISPSMISTCMQFELEFSSQP